MPIMIKYVAILLDWLDPRQPLWLPFLRDLTTIEYQDLVFVI